MSQQQPLQFSLRELLLFFWAAAPEEELTREDIIVKLGTREHSIVARTLAQLQDDGILLTKPATKEPGVGGPAQRIFFLSPEALDVMRAPLQGPEARRRSAFGGPATRRVQL